MTLLVADKTTNDIYRVTGSFNPDFGYSAAQNSAGATGFIGAFDASSAALPGFDGALTPVVTGLGNPGGEAFIAGVPEFSTWGMMMLGFTALGFAGHRGTRLFRPAAVKAWMRSLGAPLNSALDCPALTRFSQNFAALGYSAARAAPARAGLW